MNLPTIDEIKKGICASPMSFSSYTSVKVPRRKPMKERRLLPSDVDNALGETTAMKMYFVPQMMIALALEYATEFVGYCADRKITEFKKHNRLIRTCVEGYANELKSCYGKAFNLYVQYYECFLNYIDVDRFRMWCSISNVVSKQKGRNLDREAIAKIAMVHHLINFAEDYDDKFDDKLRKTFKIPIRRNKSPMIQLIIAMCIEFEEEYGFKLKKDPMIETNMKVIANRAACLAEDIFNAEKQQ